MNIASTLGGLLPLRRTIGRCPECQTKLLEGAVLDATGVPCCLACSIMRALGVTAVRTLSAQSAGDFAPPRRIGDVRGLAS